MLGPLIASAEIIRRSLWGLLRVEWEIVKSQVDTDDTLELAPMKIGSSSRDGVVFGEMRSMNRTQLVGELSIYTAIFAVLGLLIAAHRETL